MGAYFEFPADFFHFFHRLNQRIKSPSHLFRPSLSSPSTLGRGLLHHRADASHRRRKEHNVPALKEDKGLLTLLIKTSGHRASFIQVCWARHLVFRRLIFLAYRNKVLSLFSFQLPFSWCLEFFLFFPRLTKYGSGGV